MEDQLKKYELYIRSVRTLSILSGMWPLVQEHPVLLRILLFLGGFSTTMMCVSSIHYCWYNAANIMLLTRSLGLLVGFGAAVLKIWCFVSRHDSIVYLFKTLEYAYSSDSQIPSQIPELLKRLPHFIRFCYALAICCFATNAMYVTVTMMRVRKGKYIPMYPGIFPFSYETGGFNYWSIFGFQFTAGWFLSSITCSVDSMFGVFAFQICGQFRILASEFRALTPGKDYRDKIRGCMERHGMLYRCRDILQDIFGLIAIWMTISSAWSLCALIFQVSQMAKITIQTALMLVLFVSLKTIQAFTYAWYGNLITQESEACINAIYSAAWHGSKYSAIAKDALIILMQRPIVLKAKGCLHIQLDMFSKVMNTAVSYFFLLQTLDAK